MTLLLSGEKDAIIRHYASVIKDNATELERTSDRSNREVLISSIRANLDRLEEFL